jgi:hypothetical protein
MILRPMWANLSKDQSWGLTPLDDRFRDTIKQFPTTILSSNLAVMQMAQVD